MNFIVSRIFSFFAWLLFYREWCEFKKKLINEYKVGAKNIPPALAQQLLISGEDHRFFQHKGIDLIAICRAIWRRITSNKREGASTIEMQIVRIISGRFELTMRRKIREMAMATLLTTVVPKEHLPALYLQIGYYGWHMNGFSEACRRLNVNIGIITQIEIAQLIARLKYPQSQFISQRRWDQINIRGQHLLRLYTKHKLDRTYKNFINATPIYETI